MKSIAACVSPKGGVLGVVLCFFAAGNPLHAQWVQTNRPPSGSTSITALAVSGTNLFAGTRDGLFRSTDNGSYWIRIASFDVRALATSGTTLFVGTTRGLYWTHDNGASWRSVYPYNLINQFISSIPIEAIAVSGSTILACSNEALLGGVYVSTDNGVSWTYRGLSYPFPTALAISGTIWLVGTNNGVFCSTDNGVSWTHELPGPYVNTFAISGATLFAGTASGVYLSTNNGLQWKKVRGTGLMDTHVLSLAVSGTDLFAGTWRGGVFLSTNNGESWTEVNHGLTNTYVRVLAVSGAYLFAGTDGGEVWRRPLSEMITSVPAEGGSTDLPTHFGLDQNYPNPFNPATTISFRLPSKAFVSLKVFDALGREVATLVSEELPAGRYARQWHAAGVPSGVYFYRLEAGTFGATKKLVLLR